NKEEYNIKRKSQLYSFCNVATHWLSSRAHRLKSTADESKSPVCLPQPNQRRSWRLILVLH
ncbi:unnamed protein product, partial [Brassica oleracea]